MTDRDTDTDAQTDKAAPVTGRRHTYREGGRTVETTSTDPSVEQR